MAFEYHSIVDRNSAISFAMQNMKEDDILLIAGKGHETYQEIAGKKIPFDDVQVVVNEYKKIQQKRYIEEFRYDDFTDRELAEGCQVLSNIGHQRFDLNRYENHPRRCVVCRLGWRSI